MSDISSVTGTPSGGRSQGLTGALERLTMQLQAMLHQNQTLSNLPSSARQYLQQARQQLDNPAALLGGQVPPPAAPTAQWLNQAAASLLSQVVLNQPNRGSGQPAAAPPGPTPPTTPPGPPPGQNPYGWGGGYNGPTPGPWTTPLVASQHGGGGGGGGSPTGIGSWARSNAPMIGARIAGPWGAVAGAVVAAAAEVPAEVRSQRDKNAYYQSIEGGDNLSGFGERASEELYRWTTPVVFSSSEAREAFKGVTKLGYNSKVEGGIGRQEALDFVYHGKTRRGATVEESLQTLQVNSKNALGNLNDLNDALNAVSDSAGKAGINSQMARAEFTQLMDQAIKQGYGSQASSAAALEQKTKNSYGRAFQDVDVSARVGMTQAYMVASATGMSVSDYLTAGVTARGYAEQRRDDMARNVALKPGVEAWVKEQIAKSGGAGSLTEEVVAQIAEEMLRKFYPNDSYALSAVIGTLTGQKDLDPVKAAVWGVQQYNDKGAEAAAQEMSAEGKKDAKDISRKNKVDTTTTVQRARMSHHNPRRLGTLDREHEGGFLGFGGHDSKAYEAYQDWRDKNDGHQDPVIHHLLNKIDGDDKTKVAVSTKDGKKVVSLAAAIKRHRNELASGQAVILPEKGKGQTVAELLGKDKVDPLRDFSKEAKGTEKAAETYLRWEKDHTVKDKKGREKLEIGLTAEARRLLSVMDSTGVSGASATANPPLSPYAANPSYAD